MAAVHSPRDVSGALQPICHELTLVRPSPLTAAQADSAAILIIRSARKCRGSHPEPHSNGSQVRMPGNLLISLIWVFAPHVAIGQYQTPTHTCPGLTV
jgi:hypothetical protein